MTGYRAIPGYEGRYTAREDGIIFRIMADGTKQPVRPYATGRMKHVRWCVMLTDASGKRRTHLVLSLMVAAFFGKRPKGMKAFHLDGMKCNNAVENIAFLTERDLGKRTGGKATRSTVYKIDSGGEVYEIYKSVKDAAMAEKVAVSTMSQWLNGKVKKKRACIGYAFVYACDWSEDDEEAYC